MRVRLYPFALLSLSVLRVQATPEDPTEQTEALARLRAEAQTDLGRGGAAHIVSPFVIASPNPAVASAGAAFTRSLVTAYVHDRFAKTPTPVSVFIFPEASHYEAFCKLKTQRPCISPFGFYLAGSRTIVMRGGADGTLSHELVHPFVEADFPTAPIWLNEGIASLFEGPVLAKPGEIHGNVNWRLPRLQHALNHKEEESEVNVERLLTTSDEDFRERKEDLHYAIARFFCLWLDQKGKLWEFYHAYRDNTSSDPKGQKAFTDTMGMTPAEASKPWRSWIRTLRRP